MKTTITIIFALIILCVLPLSAAYAFDVNAGPIWSNDDAPSKCHTATQWYGGWNGQWKTTVQKVMSVCGAKNGLASTNPNDANAGPIWDNNDASGKCTAACKWYGGWNGQWTTVTVIQGQMSVCGCNQKVNQ